MARATIKMSGGMAKFNVAEHSFYLKPVSMNPYLGSEHDGFSVDYNKGFSSKPIPWLYRFRHNLLPQGMQTGFYSRNPGGKYVHWLEVSTIEKMRVRIFTDEAFPPVLLSVLVILFTMYHCYRYLIHHPDITLYNITLWTTKPFISQVRFATKHPLDKPCFKYIQRVPEFYNIEDPIREMYRQGRIANDPWYDFIKGLGREDELLLKSQHKGWGEAGAGKLLPGVSKFVSYDRPNGHNPGMFR